jgi:hypothetical protein
VEVFDARREADYDIVIFAKTYSLADRSLAGRTRARGGGVVFDLCDNHFYNPHDLPKYRQVREELLDMLSLAQQVVCTTPVLAEIVRKAAPWAADPIVIGDAVERLTLPKAGALEPFEGVRLLWFGSEGAPNAPAGMADLLCINDQLIAFAERTPMELVVCSNSRDKYRQLIEPLPFPTRYVEWSLTGFPAVLASVDAVVIPISPNPFTACKTHNRLTMALHAGVPVIADGIDSYREFASFCTLDDWAGGLERLAADASAERDRAAGARAYIERHWTGAALALKWEAALGLAAAPRAQTEASVAIAPTPTDVPAAARASASVISNPPSAGTMIDAPRLEGALQGALDFAGGATVSGWVRAPADPTLKPEVRLVVGGRVVAAARACDPRPDLAASGFKESDCGFVLALPAGEDPGSVEIGIAGSDWRFPATPMGPTATRTAAEAGGDRPESILQPAATPPHREAAVAALAVQSDLLRELESLSLLMDSAREAAARLVIAAGDDAALGRRVLRLFAKDLKPELNRVVGWGERERSVAPLN